MLDRVLKLIVTLTVLLFLLQCVIGALSRALEAALVGAFAAGSSLGSPLAAVGILGLIAGLGVRMLRALTARGGRAGREHDARERQLRLSVRRPAEGVPLTTTPDLPEDHDPAITMEDG